MKILLTIMFLLMITISYAQLNREAETIRENDPGLYELLVEFAEDKHSDDYELIVYTINNQAIASYELTEILNSPDLDKKVLYPLLNKWRVGSTSKLDYEMVVYEYENKINAKNSY